jgi:hypothetical protein
VGALLKLDRLILQHVAHSAGEDTDNRDGWCRWSTSDQWPWAWDDYRPLVDRGLLERKETWKDILLKLTLAGWAALEDCEHGYKAAGGSFQCPACEETP